MRLFILNFLLFWLIFSQLQMFSPISAQNISISVRDQREPLPGATVSLINNTDTNQVRYTTTDASGNATFINVSDGYWRIRISYIGFITQERTVLTDPLHRNFSFVLKSNAVSLSGVTITAERPYIRQEEDKMIVDPTPLIGISSNTLEVIESTPGIYVDYDAGIFLSSATPAVVYINGREQKLGNADIMNMLRNLPPGSIERIEILRTPSSKYDAASSGGIVNVVLKKGVRLGRFGNINAGMNQGRYGNRFAGISYNDSNEKNTWYANLNYSRNDVLEELSTARNQGIDTILYQNNDIRRTENQLYSGFGISHDAGKKSSWSYDGRLSLSERNTEGNSFSNLEGTAYLPLMSNSEQINNRQIPLSFSNDFGLTYKPDTNGTSITTLFTWQWMQNPSEQNYATQYTLPFDTVLRGRGDVETQRHFFILQSDLVKPMKHGINVETGIKASWQQYQSETNFFTLLYNSEIDDSSRSSSFHYDELIAAAYLQASKTLWAGIILKTGCRLEHTRMNGQQSFPSDTGFVVNSTGLFPYVYLSRPLPSIMGIQLTPYLIFRRTISRPDYDMLNPSTEYLDAYLYQSGNPALRPQYTQNAEFNISFNDFPVFAMGYSKTTDIFSQVVYADETRPGVQKITWDNLGSSTEKYLRGVIGIPPGGRYFFALGAQYNMTVYEGWYDGEPLSRERGSWRLFSFHSLKLGKNTKLSLSGFMMLNGQRGFYDLGDFGSLNAGITQMFMNQRLQVTLNGRDLLRTMVTSFELNQGSISSYGERYADQQRIGINIRYNFGLGKKDRGNGFNMPDDDAL